MALKVFIEYTAFWVCDQGRNEVTFRREISVDPVPLRGDIVSGSFFSPESFFCEKVIGRIFEITNGEIVLETENNQTDPFDPSDVLWYEENGWELERLDLYDHDLKEKIASAATTYMDAE